MPACGRVFSFGSLKQQPLEPSLWGRLLTAATLARNSPVPLRGLVWKSFRHRLICFHGSAYALRGGSYGFVQ
ncbi:hypothetical protein BDV59DRAFT_167587 [Aspergillus ambiguus]|uniref:uncharacterized protein n=1 Tax=Aspergillus ambiguus TaxID=176160 RepID=UPI003CCCF7CF